MSQCHMTLEIFVCTLHAEKSQTLVKALNFTCCCGRGTKPERLPSPVCFCQAEKWKEGLCASGRGEGASSVESAFPLSLISFLLPHNESVSPVRSESL